MVSTAEGLTLISVSFGSGAELLEGTDLAVSSRFQIDTLRKDGLRVRATVHLVDGQRLVCRNLELSTERGEIDRTLLHGLGLATMIRQAAALATGRVGEPAPGGHWEDSPFEAGAIHADVRRHIKRGPLGARRQLTDAFFAEVAATYRQAIKDREKTATAVARLHQSWFGYKTAGELPTARRWIAMARKGGFLEATVKGRKGG